MSRKLWSGKKLEEWNRLRAEFPGVDTDTHREVFGMGWTRSAMEHSVSLTGVALGFALAMGVVSVGFAVLAAVLS